MTSIEDISFIQDFFDVFLESIPGLPPKQDINFTIELDLGATPISRTPYHMNIPDLIELKM